MIQCTNLLFNAKSRLWFYFLDFKRNSKLDYIDKFLVHISQVFLHGDIYVQVVFVRLFGLVDELEAGEGDELHQIQELP